MNSPIIVLLRGHIRASFDNKQLYNFINAIAKYFDIHLYIHTWSTYSSSLSWRKIEDNPTLVTEIDILSYFEGIECLSTNILIDNDSEIHLIGDITGNIFSTKLPKLAWKRMWFGNYHLIHHLIQESNLPLDTVVINTRFDILENSHSLQLCDIDDLINFIKNASEQTANNGNIFLNDSSNLLGIDNFYIGTIETMLKLINEFHTNMDDINKRYAKLYHQEVSVYYENMRLFSLHNKPLVVPDIEKYYKPQNGLNAISMNLFKSINTNTFYENNNHLFPVKPSIRSSNSMKMTL